MIKELVPSSHQRCELSNTILPEQSFPIPDSLGEEATFINICISNGNLKCHRVLISTTPGFGDKVICWYTGRLNILREKKGNSDRKGVISVMLHSRVSKEQIKKQQMNMRREPVLYTGFIFI